MTTPNKAPSPRLFYEDSPVPGARKKWKIESCGNESDASRDSSDAGASLPVSHIETGAEKGLSGEQVKKEESKTKKIMIRIVFGAAMFSIFAGSVRDN